jgi:hypothetical protein
MEGQPKAFPRNSKVRKKTGYSFDTKHAIALPFPLPRRQLHFPSHDNDTSPGWISIIPAGAKAAFRALGVA